MLSTLKDNSIKYPVMNLIAAPIGFRSSGLVVSIYPIDNTRKEKNGDPDYGPLSCFFVLIMCVLLKLPNLMSIKR
jgi:hypothetical protein